MLIRVFCYTLNLGLRSMMFSHVLIHPYIFLVTPTRKLVTVKKREHASELHIQAATWSLVIVDEVQYVKLISLIIDAEISHAINQSDIDTGSTSLF